MSNMSPIVQGVESMLVGKRRVFIVTKDLQWQLQSEEDTHKKGDVKAKCQRGLWLAPKSSVYLLCSALLLWQSISCFRQYLQKETVALLSLVPIADTTFISFTICPAFEVAYKQDILTAKYGSDRVRYGTNGNYETPLLINSDPTVVFDDATFDLGEIVNMVKVATVDSGEITMKFDRGTEEYLRYGNWTIKYHYLYGKCYSFDVGKDVADMDVTSVVFESFLPIYLFLHHPGQYFDYDSMTKVRGDIGQRLLVNIGYELYINTLEKKSQLPCNPAMDSELDQCLGENLPKRLVDMFGCTVPYLAMSEKEQKVCNPNNVTLREAAFKAFLSIMSGMQRSLCERPCASMTVFVGYPIYGPHKNDSLAYIKLYFSATTKVKRSLLDYSFLTMVSEVIGYSGLLLGLSVIDITRIVDLVATRFGEGGE